MGHESFKKDLNSFHATTSFKPFISTSALETHSNATSSVETSDLLETQQHLPHTPTPPLPSLSDDSGRKSLSKSQSDSKLLMNSNGCKQSGVKGIFNDLNLMNLEKQTTHKQEQTIDQQEQVKPSTTDMVDEKELQEKSSSDLKSSTADTMDQQEQEGSSMDMNEQQKQTKLSTLRQMDINNPYLKPAQTASLKREQKNKQHINPPVHSTVNNQSRDHSVSNLSHLPGTISKVYWPYVCLFVIVTCTTHTGASAY